MPSADSIRQLFKQAELRIRPEADQRVAQDMLEAQQQSQKNATTTRKRRSTIMRSPLTKLAIAAAITIACVTGLIMWTGTGSGIALADVLTRLQQVSVYMYQMSSTTTGLVVNDKPLEQEMQGTVLMSQDLGMKMTMEMDMGFGDPNAPEPMLQETYMLPQQKRMVSLISGQKMYMQIDLDDARFEEMQKQNNDPSAMVKQVLQCDYTSLGRSSIDGIEVEGFQTTDPNYLGGMMGEVDVKIWVDVKTQLPVRSEMDMTMGMQMGPTPTSVQIHVVVYNFQWDVSVDASEFEPVIPDDYTTLAGGPIKMPEISEETAIQGLKLCADLSGAYPEKLDMMTLMSQIGKVSDVNVPATQQLLAEDEDLPREERFNKNIKEQTKKMMDVMMPIQGIGTFYMTLTQEKKDPAYYGKTVTPEDTDQVLMRWKVSDTEYRVIFGGLHVETVTADVLAELESNLPK